MLKAIASGVHYAVSDEPVALREKLGELQSTLSIKMPPRCLNICATTTAAMKDSFAQDSPMFGRLATPVQLRAGGRGNCGNSHLLLENILAPPASDADPDRFNLRVSDLLPWVVTSC